MSCLMVQADASLCRHVGDTHRNTSAGSKHVRMRFNLSLLNESLVALRKFAPFACYYSDANVTLPRHVGDCDEEEAGG